MPTNAPLYLPRDSWRRKHIKEWFFRAAWHGCLQCVERCVEEHGVDVDIKSDHAGYTAMDWFNWTVAGDVAGATAVRTYLVAVTLRNALNAQNAQNAWLMIGDARP